MKRSTAPISDRRRSARGKLLAVACIALLTTGIGLATAAPAQAAGNKSVYGNIKCTAYPNIAIGTTATAKGDVEFSMNAHNNAASLGTVGMGYSSAYSAWGWKWWAGSAGTFTAYAWGSAGAVSAVNRYCQNILS
ncbi:hypothetical protein [Leifsonia sp. NPDC058248]|uniref:hypothetical protein n=1 Tax=Leifsonia sp. NPDC058248 TaxID=3346402 RepID=UPI0036DEA3BF